MVATTGPPILQTLGLTRDAVRALQRRRRWLTVLAGSSWSLTGVFLSAAMGIITLRLAGQSVPAWPIIGGIATGAALVGGALWAVRRFWDAPRAARELDHAARSHDALSTALSLDNQAGPIAELVRSESERRARTANAASTLPAKGLWKAPSAALAAVAAFIAAGFWVPPRSTPLREAVDPARSAAVRADVAAIKAAVAIDAANNEPTEEFRRLEAEIEQLEAELADGSLSPDSGRAQAAEALTLAADEAGTQAEKSEDRARALEEALSKAARHSAAPAAKRPDGTTPQGSFDVAPAGTGAIDDLLAAFESGDWEKAAAAANAFDDASESMTPAERAEAAERLREFGRSLDESAKAAASAESPAEVSNGDSTEKAASATPQGQPDRQSSNNPNPSEGGAAESGDVSQNPASPQQAPRPDAGAEPTKPSQAKPEAPTPQRSSDAPPPSPDAAPDNNAASDSSKSPGAASQSDEDRKSSPSSPQEQPPQPSNDTSRNGAKPDRSGEQSEGRSGEKPAESSASEAMREMASEASRAADAIDEKQPSQSSNSSRPEGQPAEKSSPPAKAAAPRAAESAARPTPDEKTEATPGSERPLASKTPEGRPAETNREKPSPGDPNAPNSTPSAKPSDPAQQPEPAEPSGTPPPGEATTPAQQGPQAERPPTDPPTDPARQSDQQPQPSPESQPAQQQADRARTPTQEQPSNAADGAKSSRPTPQPSGRNSGTRATPAAQPAGGTDPKADPAPTTDPKPSQTPDPKGSNQPGGAGGKRMEGLADQIDRIRQQAASGKVDRQRSENLRKQAEKLMKGMTPQERAELEKAAQEWAKGQKDPGQNDPGQSKPSPEGPSTAETPANGDSRTAGASRGPRTTPTDRTLPDLNTKGETVRPAQDKQSPTGGQTLAEWLAEPAPADPSSPTPSSGRSGSTITEGANRAIEQRRVPKGYDALVRRVFDRIGQRAPNQSTGSPTPAAEQMAPAASPAARPPE